jgi:ATP-dependent DNA helicase RecG
MKLSDSVQYVKGVGPKMKEKLGRLGIHTVEDLISFYPRRVPGLDEDHEDGRPPA